jgi:eukaryotic-like serine/threonine-protein kinase
LCDDLRDGPAGRQRNLLSLQVSHHLLPEGRTAADGEERAGVKTLPRPGAAPGRSAGTTLQDTLVLGRYRLLEQLGSGGHGSVWIARDEHDGQRVAVKRIPCPANDPQERSRIEREGRATARLGHPAIVALFATGDDADAHYLVSELVEGPSLATLYAHRAVGERDVVEIGVALADALAHAHDRGVVHRDVKPANVIVPEHRPAGAAPVKLTDFGIARLTGEQALTRTGDVVGTLAYMAPEQADGRDTGPQADLYSLALTLYEGLSGSNPIRGETVAVTARRVGGPVPSLALARPDLPAGLCGAIDRALATDPRQRGTLDQLRQALAAVDGSTELRRAPAMLTAMPPIETATITMAHGGGVVAGRAADATIDVERGGRTTRTTRLAPAGRGAVVGAEPPTALEPEPARDPAAEPAAPRTEPVRRIALSRRAARVLGAATTGALCGAALATAPGIHGARLAAAVGAGAALLALAAPGVGWLLLAIGSVGWLGAIGQTGAALIVIVGLVPVPVLLVTRPALWSLPALAPALGALGAAAATPALAGRLAAPAPVRAALAALSYWWLALAEALSHRRLLLGIPAGAHPRADWSGSLGNAVHDALIPLVTTDRLAMAGVWAAAAIVLPWLVRGRASVPRAIAALVWAAALTVGEVALAAHVGAPRPPHPLAAFALAAVVAFAAPLAPRPAHRRAAVA